MKPTRKLTPEQRFFFNHAGWSYEPTRESSALGRTRCAVTLADAESVYLMAHRAADVRVTWEHDSDGAYSARRDRERFTTCESCMLWHGKSCLTSLHSITDADDNYKRVIRAELAHECIDELRAIVGAAS